MTSKFGTLLLYLVVPMLALLAFHIVMFFVFGHSKPRFTPNYIGGQVIQYSVNLFVTFGLFKVILKLASNQEPQWHDFINPITSYFSYLMATILFTAIVMTGCLLFIIPGIIWSIQFQQFPYVIIDKNLGPIAALKRSSQLTASARWKLLGFGFTCVIIGIAGLLCFIVGIIPAFLVTCLATIHVYKQLTDSTDQEQPSAEPTVQAS